MEEELTNAAPRIVFSEEDKGRMIDDQVEDCQSGADDSSEMAGTADETRQVGFDDASEEQAEAAEFDNARSLGVATQRSRKTRSTYRDSVFTSYSIYADCFDSMKLESQSSAASIIKRQSMHRLAHASVEASSSDEAKPGDA